LKDEGIRGFVIFDILLTNMGTLKSVFIVPDWQQDFQPLYRHGSGKKLPCQP
jgi:hypothetical protein